MLGIYLPLITTNCAVLGVALLVTGEDLGLPGTIVVALGAAFGFSLVIVCFAALRERLDDGEAPTAMRGAPLALVTVGIMALAFQGFRGVGA